MGRSTGAEVFDIADARAERVKAKAARREGRGDVLVVRFGGVQIAELGPEFPLDVLEPLQSVNLDLALLVRQALEAAAAKSGREQVELLLLITDMLAANPDLPKEVIEAVKEMTRRLFGKDGYAALVQARPTPWDVSAIFSRLMGWYGLSLGESSGSSTPASGGETSKPISSTGTGSTPETPGETPPTPASSESAV